MTITRQTWRIGSASVALALCAVAAGASSASADQRSVPACSASNLSAKATGSGAGMSQPAVYITVTNTSGQACTLNGYPTINRAWTQLGRQQISVTNGAVMNAPETKPKRIVLAPNGNAWFAIGSATAFDSPLVTFTRVAFATAPGTGNARVVIQLQASAPTGKPYPLGVTAFAPGVGRSLSLRRPAVA